jgi:selenocysteine lyase/cysteine desulfurase
MGERRLTLEPALARLWQQGEGEGAVFGLSQATQALAIVHEVLRAEVKGPLTAWVPDYFCDGALHHLRAGGARLVFYPVDAALRPDWAACAALLADGPPQLFLLVHYFGTVNDCAGARAFCARTGARLMEDAVHVLRPVGDIGTVGDFVCYSPRKFLALPDGGVLVVRGARLGAAAGAAAARLAPAAARTARWRLRALLPRAPLRQGPARPVGIDQYAPQPAPQPALWMSRYTRARLAALAASGAFAAEERAQQAVAAEIIARLSGWHGLMPLAPAAGATPYFFAMRGRDEATVAAALAELRQGGAMVAPWPGLAPEVRAAPERHATAFHIRRTLLRFTPRELARRHPLHFLDTLASGPGLAASA